MTTIASYSSSSSSSLNNQNEHNKCTWKGGKIQMNQFTIVSELINMLSVEKSFPKIQKNLTQILQTPFRTQEYIYTKDRLIKREAEKVFHEELNARKKARKVNHRNYKIKDEEQVAINSQETIDHINSSTINHNLTTRPSTPSQTTTLSLAQGNITQEPTFVPSPFVPVESSNQHKENHKITTIPKISKDIDQQEKNNTKSLPEINIQTIIKDSPNKKSIKEINKDINKEINKNISKNTPKDQIKDPNKETITDTNKTTKKLIPKETNNQISSKVLTQISQKPLQLSPQQQPSKQPLLQSTNKPQEPNPPIIQTTIKTTTQTTTQTTTPTTSLQPTLSSQQQPLLTKVTSQNNHNNNNNTINITNNNTNSNTNNQKSSNTQNSTNHNPTMNSTTSNPQPIKLSFGLPSSTSLTLFQQNCQQFLQHLRYIFFTLISHFRLLFPKILLYLDELLRITMASKQTIKGEPKDIWFANQLAPLLIFHPLKQKILLAFMKILRLHFDTELLYCVNYFAKQLLEQFPTLTLDSNPDHLKPYFMLINQFHTCKQELIQRKMINQSTNSLINSTNQNNNSTNNNDEFPIFAKLLFFKTKLLQIKETKRFGFFCHFLFITNLSNIPLEDLETTSRLIKSQYLCTMYPDLFHGISSITSDLQNYINSWDMNIELSYAKQWMIMSKAPEYLESTLQTKVSSDISLLNLYGDNNINCSLNDSILTTEWPSLFDMIPSPPITSTITTAKDNSTSLASVSTLVPQFLPTCFTQNEILNQSSNPTINTPSKERKPNAIATSLLEQSLNLSPPLFESPFTSSSKK